MRFTLVIVNYKFVWKVSLYHRHQSLSTQYTLYFTKTSIEQMHAYNNCVSHLSISQLLSIFIHCNSLDNSISNVFIRRVYRFQFSPAPKSVNSLVSVKFTYTKTCHASNDANKNHQSKSVLCSITFTEISIWRWNCSDDRNTTILANDELYVDSRYTRRKKQCYSMGTYVACWIAASNWQNLFRIEKFKADSGQNKRRSCRALYWIAWISTNNGSFAIQLFVEIAQYRRFAVAEKWIAVGFDMWTYRLYHDEEMQRTYLDGQRWMRYQCNTIPNRFRMKESEQIFAELSMRIYHKQWLSRRISRY